MTTLIIDLFVTLWNLIVWCFSLWYLIHACIAYDHNPSPKNFQDCVLWMLMIIWITIQSKKDGAK